MAKEEQTILTVVPLRDFVTAKAAYKTGVAAKVGRADARAFIRRKAAALEGTPEAEAAQAAAKVSEKAKK